MSTTITYDDFAFSADSTAINIYTSDFGGSTDGWTVSANGSIHTEDPYNSKANVLVFVLDDTLYAAHALKAPINLEIGEKYKITGWVDIDAANNSIEGVRIYNDAYSSTPSNLVWSTSEIGWSYLDVEFTALANDLIFYATEDDASPLTTEGDSGEDDEFAVVDISIEKVVGGFPTPYVSRTQTPISYGNRWGQDTDFSLDGQIVGTDFDNMILKQNALISGFSRDFQSLDVQEDNTSIAGFPAKNCKIRNISFDGSKYTNMLNYSIGIKSYDEGLFSGTFGILDPVDRINMVENTDGSIAISHETSARGIPANNKSSIENAKDFVHLHTGWRGHITPYFIEYENFNPILTTVNETINRMDGTYGVSEAYMLNKTGENALISGHSVEISSGFGDPFISVGLTTQYKGYLGESVEQVRGKIPSITSEAYYDIATGISQIADLNTGAISFSVSEVSGASSIQVESRFDNNKLFNESNAYFDYEMSFNTNELTSITSVEINGVIMARGNRKEKLKQAENFLENNVYSYTEVNCHHEAKHACYLYGLANEEYNNLSKPYSLRAYPSSCKMQKDRQLGAITLSASFDDSYQYSDNVKSSSWNISVRPPLRTYLPTTDVVIYPKHIFWNSNVITRSSIQVNASASSFDSLNQSYGLTTIDSFVDNVYNIYVDPNSDILETAISLQFNENSLNYTKSKSWGFHHPDEWVNLPAPPKPIE